MKKLLFLSTLLFLLAPFKAFNQEEEDTIGLKKFFWNVTPFVGLVSDTEHSVIKETKLVTGGLLYKMGNNWMMHRDKRTSTFFKLTWIRLGIFPQGLIATPLHVGLGLNYDLNQTSSFEISMNGGLVISTDDALDPELEFNYLIAPEAKINFGSFSLGAEYSIRNFIGAPEPLWHYIGLVIGGRFGEIKK